MHFFKTIAGYQSKEKSARELHMTFGTTVELYVNKPNKSMWTNLNTHTHMYTGIKFYTALFTYICRIELNILFVDAE